MRDRGQTENGDELVQSGIDRMRRCPLGVVATKSDSQYETSELFGLADVDDWDTGDGGATLKPLILSDEQTECFFAG